MGDDKKKIILLEGQMSIFDVLEDYDATEDMLGEDVPSAADLNHNGGSECALEGDLAQVHCEQLRLSRKLGQKTNQ